MKILLLLSILFVQTIHAQKYFTKNGHTEFKGSVDTFEPIEAINKSTTVVLNSKTGDIASLLFVKAFHFDIALMEEHFNENYMDSDEFPKATFKGNIKDLDLKNISEKETTHTLKGILTIKGIKKEVNTEALIKKEDECISIHYNFSVKPSDFKIDIPKIVENKIAKEIKISGNYELKEKK